MLTAELRRIDERGEILHNDLKHGRISYETWVIKHHKLIDRAGVLFARQEARRAGK